MLLTEAVLRLSTHKLSRGRLNAAVTALLLEAEGKELRIAFDGMARGRYGIDEALIEALFDGTRSGPARLQLARSTAFAFLSPATFKRLYSRLWRSRGSTAGWRFGLAWSLQMFLRRHPDQGHAYAPMVSRQMRDRVEEVALLGLFTAGYLGKALTARDAKYLCACLEKRSLKTMTALNALTEIYSRWTATPEPARRVLSSPKVVSLVDHLLGDNDYKLNAAPCSRAMRRAVGRAGTAKVGTSAHE